MSELKDAIRRAAGNFEKDEIEKFICTVDSVNQQDRTCTCIPVTGNATTIIEGVKLMTNVNDGFLLIPKVGSEVMVTYVKKQLDFICYVSMFSEIENMYLIADKIQFNGGEHFGLVKVTELITKLNAIESDINNLKSAMSSWVVVPSDGGAALKVAAGAWFSNTLTPSQRQDIENTKITHGS